jgi:hypothetical protein
MDNLYSFHRLSLEERTQFILGNGVLLCSRYFAGRKVFLYHTGKFYAEIWFDTRKSRVSNIIPFTTIKCLKPYLDIIDISNIFKTEGD